MQKGPIDEIVNGLSMMPKPVQEILLDDLEAHGGWQNHVREGEIIHALHEFQLHNNNTKSN